MNYSNGIELIFGKAPSLTMNRGLLFGENIFTSFSSWNGEIFSFSEHFNRLSQSINFLYPKLFDLNELKKCWLKISELSSTNNYFRVTALVSPDKKNLAWHLYAEPFSPSFQSKELSIEKRNWRKTFLNQR